MFGIETFGIDEYEVPCNVTLKVIGPILKLRRKWSVASTVPGVYLCVMFITRP